jgi:hypothetical protein
MNSAKDIRAWPRLNRPVLCRPRRLGLLRSPPAGDMGLSGVRIYSDDKRKVGEQLEIELLLPDDSSLTAAVVVAWVEALEGEAPALYDVGLRFLELRREDRERLGRVLPL